jgi:hypothetical protein
MIIPFVKFGTIILLWWNILLLIQIKAEAIIRYNPTSSTTLKKASDDQAFA